MFKKVLVANRGLVAVRIIDTCHDMGISTVALYDRSDRGSLHVRLSDQCVELDSSLGYLDRALIVRIARELGAEAIHPGYGFLSERSDFIRLCEENGIVFIGPSSAIVRRCLDRTAVLSMVAATGISVVPHSDGSFDSSELDALRSAAEKLGFPFFLKSCAGGRGRAMRLVGSAEELLSATDQVNKRASLLFGGGRVYLEKAILPSRLVEVQLLGDSAGDIVHLGTRDGSMQRRGVKLIAEAPAPFLSLQKQDLICQDAIKIGRLLGYVNAGTAQFILDEHGNHYFSEIKCRLQVEHAVTELVTHLDIVREQLEIAAGGALGFDQDDVRVNGCALQCRINAVDPLNDYLPSPGKLRSFRMPGGPHVRVDRYGYAGCQVPVLYDSLLANISVWGRSRQECIQRMSRSLIHTAINGVHTNIVLHKSILDSEEFGRGEFSTDCLEHKSFIPCMPESDLRDLACAAAIAFALRNQRMSPVVPDRFREGWHTSDRILH
jgi:acetyl/propionyl-CoA carboxylase alpha subunit